MFTDTSAPVFTDCPFAVAGYAYQLQDAGHVHWDDPTGISTSFFLSKHV